MRIPLCALLTVAVLGAPSFAFGQGRALAPSQPFSGAQVEPAEPAEWRDPDLDAFYPRRGHFSFKASVNAGARSLYGSLIGLGGIEVAAGGDTKAGSFYGAIGGAGGLTEGGLSYGAFSVGPDLEWNIDMLRLGVHPRIGYVAIGRVTEDDPFELFTWGIGGSIGLDMFRSDGLIYAFGVEPKCELATTAGLFDDSANAFIGGVNVFLQLRFRAPKRHPKVDGGSY